MKKIVCLIWLLYLFTPGYSFTITPEKKSDSYNSGKKEFDPNQYKRATEGLEYNDISKTEEKKKEKIRENKRRNDENATHVTRIPEPSKKSYLGSGQIVLIVLIVIVLFVIIYFISRNIPPSNPSVSEDPDWISEAMERESGPQDILQLRLDEAVAQSNYAMAVRILYLQVLVQLNQHKLIIWKKDKTNADYVAEMRKSAYHSAFRNITLVYEFSWFSETAPDQATFLRSRPLFDSFRQKLKHTDLKEA